MLNFGGFLSSNFWTNYRCSSSASVEDLLSSKDCTVDKLLDDDDCLQEFKNYNDKLIKYFDHDKLKVLVDYITVMPELDEQKRGHKYPFIAGEIFNCEINQILDKFFEAPVKVKPTPALTPSESATEVTDTSVTKEDDDDKKVDAKEETPTGDEKDEEAPVTEDKKEATEGEEKATTEEPAAATEDTKEEEKDEGAKNLEEVKTEEKKDESVEMEVSEIKVDDVKQESSDEKPQQDGESKEEEEAKPEEKEEEEKKEEPKAEVAAVEDKEEEKQEEAKTEDKDKNTQEPESEEQDKENDSKPVEENKISEEPEEEEAAKKTDDKDKDLNSMASFSTLQTEALDEEEEDIEEGNKFVLLERLFKFLKTDEEELNPVLSGYFCKLVSLLISRKQKQLFPFVFAKDSTVIEDLLKHVYQKSISEILNKLLTQIDSDHEPEIIAEVKAKQQMAVGTLIANLSSEKSEEHNLNASTIIQDMFEIKEFYNLICGKENLTKIVDFALAGMSESTKASKCCSLTVLNQIVLNHIERQKKKEQKADEDKDQGVDEDDDMIVQQNSDDENAEDDASNPTSAAAQTAVLVDILKDRVGVISTILQADHEGPTIQSSVNEAHIVPLGQQRLYTIELVLRMVQLKKEALYTSMGRSKVFFNIMELVKQYPWNNFMHLKVTNMCDEILENCDNETFKKDFLESSAIGKALVGMGAEPSFEMNSGRLIRSGYMSLVVSVSNKLIKKFKGTSTKPEDATVVEYLDNVGEEWRAFVDDELANSNINDNKTLGGSTKPDGDGGSEGGDDPNNIDDQMEKIMQRFSNFNQMLTSGTNDEEDEAEEGNEDAEDASPGDDETKDESQTESSASMHQDKVDLVEIAPLETEYIDNSYWNLTAPKDEDVDYDSLLAELDA